MGLIIKEILTLDEIHVCEDLQQRIWGFSELSVVPHHLIRTSIESGGLLLGAYADNQLVGFALSIPGHIRRGGRQVWKHCSIMAGVLPEARFKGIGHQIKLKQRELVIRQNIELITWTFDPLQSSNAYFNFRKLAVICRSYKEDYYGDIRDQLNRGLPTDRFEVEWWLSSERVKRRVLRVEPSSYAPDRARVNSTGETGGLLENRDIRLDLDDPRLWIEIPRSLTALKDASMELALRWRFEIREMIEHYLKQGYIVCDLVEKRNGENVKSFYLLERISLEELLARP